jgi:O-antigen ligase
MASANTHLEWWRPVPPPQAAAAAATDGPRPSKLSIWAFRALVTFAAINITAPQELMPALAPLRLALLAAGAAMAAYLSEVWSGNAPKSAPPTELKLGVGLLVWATLTLPLSLWPGGSFQFLFNQFIKSIIIFWLLARVIRTPSQLHTVFWTMTLVSVPLVYAGISQMQSGELVRGRIQGYASGLTANANDLAMMVDLILPLAVIVGMLAKTRGKRLVAFAIVGLNLLCLGATYSRGGFLGLAVMMIAAMALMARRGRWAVIGLAVVALPVTVAVLPSSYLDRLSTISDVDSDETGSAQGRWAGMKAAVEYMVTDPVTGAGLVQDAEALVKIQGNKANWLHVHNSYLAVGVDLGLPGLAMYLGMIYLAYRRLKRVERESFAAGRLEMSLMATGLRLSCLGLMTTLFFSPSAYNFPVFYLVGLALALDVAHTSGGALTVTPAAPRA